jgi:phosphatidate cytidylyltransferase
MATLPQSKRNAIVVRMLRWRITLGAALIAALVGLIWLDWHAGRPGIVLLPLAIVAAMLAAGELLAMFRLCGHEPLAWVVYAGTLLTVAASAVPGLWPADMASTSIQGVGWITVGLAMSLLIALVGELYRYDGARRATLDLSLAVFAIAYVGGLVGFLVQLRLFGGGDGHVGMLALVSLIAIVKMSDIGQYTVGRLIGKHKLVPTLSPGKTWEGLCGGLMFATATAWLLIESAYSYHWLSGGGFLHALLYGCVLVIAGVVGDLAESLLKRDAGVKDSSSWMPGFGGVLDLLDSLLVAAPVAYLFWALGWLKT